MYKTPLTRKTRLQSGILSACYSKSFCPQFIFYVHQEIRISTSITRDDSNNCQFFNLSFIARAHTAHRVHCTGARRTPVCRCDRRTTWQIEFGGDRDPWQNGQKTNVVIWPDSLLCCWVGMRVAHTYCTMYVFVNFSSFLNWKWISDVIYCSCKMRSPIGT